MLILLIEGCCRNHIIQCRKINRKHASLWRSKCMSFIWFEVFICSVTVLYADSQEKIWSRQWTKNHSSDCSEEPGWSAGISLTHSLLVCLSFPLLLFISAFLFHTLPLLSLYPLFSCSLCLTFCYFFEKRASPASKPQLKNQDKSRKQFSSFFLPPHHFLSFDFLCFKASYSLLKYAIERHIWPSKTISNLINNCQVRGKAEWVWTTLKAHQRPQKGEAWGWGKVDGRRYTHVQI